MLTSVENKPEIHIPSQRIVAGETIQNIRENNWPGDNHTVHIKEEHCPNDTAR
jgi:hypothetical protein